jgi:four helix bundle protein
MSTQSEQLKERTLQFAINVLRLIDSFPRTIAADAVSRQLAKSAPSVAANYRGTCNARSRKEFIARLGVVVDESDESDLWLTITARMQFTTTPDAERFRNEAVELRNIFAKSLGTARANAKLEKKRRKRHDTTALNDQITNDQITK